jgi:hypothetical protein
VDGTILEVANLNRARTLKDKAIFWPSNFWGKKKRNLYSEHYKEKVRFDRCIWRFGFGSDSEGVVYDLWSIILRAIMK